MLRDHLYGWNLNVLLASLATAGAMIGFGGLNAADQWPVYGYSLVDTHLHSYSKNKFFGVTLEGGLYQFAFNDKDKVLRSELYEYDNKPDIIKHFTLESGDLFVAMFKKNKKIILLAFDQKAKLIYANNFSLDFVVKLADIRINEKGEPLCLLYYYYKRNYVISLWSRKGITDIYRIEHPIDYIFFDWRSRNIHMLHKKDNRYYWAIRSKNRYYQLRLPLYISKPTFFSIGKYTFLVGVDLTGTLRKFVLRYNRISSSRIIKNSRLRYISQIVPTVFRRRFQFFMPNKDNNTIWRLEFNNFLKNSTIGGLRQKQIFLVDKIILFQKEKSLNILSQTQNLHTYLLPWKDKGINLYNIQWTIRANMNPPILSIKWRTRKTPKNYLYSYFLDHKKNSEPIGEPSILRKNQITIRNPKDGNYTLHIKAKDIRTQKESYLYHIPIFWLYDPPEPKVVWLNEVSPSTFVPGSIRFFIKNLVNIEYYAEMNQKPLHRPSKRLTIRDGTGILNGNVRTGWYYLHIQARDPKSKRISTVLHLPFSIKPYDPFFERQDVTNDSIRAEIEQLLRKIEINKDDIKTLKKIQERLDELNKRLSE